MLLRGLHIVSKQLSYLLVIVSLLLLVVAGSVYWISDAIEQRQDEIASWVGKQLGYPVTIDSAGIQWIGLMPKLHVNQLSLHSQDNKQVLLSLESLYLGLDTIESIQKASPVLNDITLTGLELSLIRTEQGELAVRGFNSTKHAKNNLGWNDWAGLLNRFHFNAITLEYIDHSTPSLSGRYYLMNGVMRHDASQWKTSATIQLPETLGQLVQLEAELDIIDKRFQLSPWKGTIKAEQLSLPQQEGGFIWQDVSILQAEANIDISFSGKGNAIESVHSAVELANIELQSVEFNNVAPVMINQLMGQFDWQGQNQDSWNLSGQELALTINNEQWPSTNVMVKRIDDLWSFSSGYLRLSDMSLLADLSTYSPELIRQQKPAGDVESLLIDYSEQSGLVNLSFALQEGAFLPWQEMPGVTGLSVKVDWDNSLANIELNSQNLTIYADKWLDDAAFFDSVTGSLKFRQGDEAWSLHSEQFTIWNDDFNIQLDGSIEQSETGAIHNDLMLKLADVAANQWKKYVPSKLLSTGFKEWSDTAFVNGKIVDGVITLRGNLADFPYQETASDGAFDMTLNVENVQLHYAPEWPDIVNVNGEVTSSGDDILIQASQGIIAGFEFADVKTEISGLSSTAVLELDGLLIGSTKKAIDFVKTSPLKERFSKSLESLESSGDSDITLKLVVPLGNVDAVEASGNVSFKQSQLYYADFANAKVVDINGLLEFDNNGVKADAIKARLFNESISVNVDPKEQHTLVSILGRISTQELNALWPESVPTFITGKSAYQVDVLVKEKTRGDFYINYDLISDLKGIEIDLPAPFYKGPRQPQKFNASMEVMDSGEVYSFTHGQLLNMIAAPQGDSWRAGISFGASAAQLPSNAITVRGDLNHISVDDWLDWSEKQLPTENSSLVNLVDDVSMSITSLTGFGQQLTHLNYAINRDGQGWQITMNSDETGKGEIYWPTDFNGPVALNIKLERLKLLLAEKTDLVEKKETLALWPSMNLSIKSFIVDEQNLGELEAQAIRKNDMWSVHSASLISDAFTAEILSGKWQQSTTADNSEVELKLTSHDVAKVLAHFDYQESLEADNVELTASISWPDNPLNFSLGNSQAEVNFAVGKGKLIEVEPGAAGRIFGLMSFAALPRRLSLDFSDLFSKGYNFDSITGSFLLADGIATTDDFIIKGPPAIIEISGPIDLLNQHYDQKVKITPNVSSTLPLAGAVAGGPIGLGVGTAIMIADKLVGSLFGTNIVNLISYSYSLTGAWDDPQLEITVASDNK